MSAPELSRPVRGKGRHYEYPPTGDLLISVTNAQSALSMPALPRWAAIEVAKVAYKMRHALPEMDEAEAVDILRNSPWSKTNRAQDRGTSIHEALEKATKGITVPLTGEAAQYVTGIQMFMAEHELEVWHTEVTVFHKELGYAGTADVIGLLDGVPVMLDYKTGTKKLYDDISLQLSALRYATEMWVDGELRPMVQVDECVGVYIRPDGYQIGRVEEPSVAFDAFCALLQVRRWQVSDSPVLGEWHSETDTEVTSE